MPLAAFDPTTLDRGWQPLIPLPPTNAKDKQGKPLQGCALVAQRLWGHGRVTLVGLDLDTLHRQSLNADGLPQTDAFWNRVLGRRADAPTETNYRDWAEQDKPTLASTAGSVRYDAGTGALVSGQIGLQGRAAAGVLSVIGFFVAYWALAIPVCWLVLRRIKRAELARLPVVLFKPRVDNRYDEVKVVTQTTSTRPAAIEALFSGEDVLRFHQLVRGMPIADEMVRYAVQLASLSRPRQTGTPDFVNDWVSWGAGTRAAQFLVLGAKARAGNAAAAHGVYRGEAHRK
jgi:hypothetical protein